VTGATVAVFAGNSWGSSVMVEGFAAGPDTDRSTRMNRVGTDYFRTLGVTTLAGRDFNEADTADTPRVAIVDEAFAARFELGREAVGKRLGQGGLDAGLDVEIVGLVRNTKYNDVKNTEPPLLYTPYRQASSVGNLTFYARSSIPPSGLLRAIPRIVNELDFNLPVNDLKTLTQQVRENIFLERMTSVLSASFAGLATLLAAVGLYGVLAYTVTQRTREIGLRMALGADAARVRTMILGQVGRMTLVGGLVWLVAAVGLARLAQSLMYEVEGLQPVILTLSSVGLFVVACAAGLVPPQRAASINPMTALRSK
jgi:predicted permease